MDERFSLDGMSPEPVDTMSEIWYRRALRILCWALVLTCFTVNIEGLELSMYSTWFGHILMILGLYILRKSDKQLAGAFGISIALLLGKTAAYWLSAFPGDSRLLSVLSPLLGIVTIPVGLVGIHCLFAGLRNLALCFGHDELAKRLKRCFWFYLSLYILLLLAMLIPVLIFVLIPYALFVLIKLPRTVSLLRRETPPGVCVAQPWRRSLWLGLAAYLLVTLAGLLAAMVFVNTPTPAASRYITPGSRETAELRETLIELGLPEMIAHDLPDEELLLYQGIYQATVCTEPVQGITVRDGGTLELTGFEAVLPGGAVRTMFYYHWRQPPKHGYTDLLSIACSYDNSFAMADGNVKAISLYDKNGVTYRQDVLNDGILRRMNADTDHIFWSTSGGGFVAQIHYRLYPNYENQRGYVAVTRQATRPTQAFNYNSVATYIHQERLWNRPYFDILSSTSSRGYSSINSYPSQNASFRSEMIFTLGLYAPPGWEE